MGSRRVNKAVEDFIIIPFVFIIGLYIVMILIDAFVQNAFFAFALKGGGILLALIGYYKKSLENYIKS